MLDPQVPYTEEEIRTQCRKHLRKNSAWNPQARIVKLQPRRGSVSYAVKIADGFAKDKLCYEEAFMNFFQPASASYRFPRSFGIIEDKFDAYLVMEYLEGPTLWQVMQEGAVELSESDANDVVDALRDLHDDQQRAQALFQTRSLTPIRHWYPQAFIFAPDGDGGRLITDLDDFISFLTVRLQAAEVDMNVVPLNEWTLAHGDVTPENFIRCTDGKLGIIDFRTTFLAPSWWEAYALRVNQAEPKWVKPLEKAMRRAEMTVPDSVKAELDKLLRWFFVFGSAYSR